MIYFREKSGKQAIWTSPPSSKKFLQRECYMHSYALALDNAICEGQVPQHRDTQKSQAEGLERSGPASREQTFTGKDYASQQKYEVSLT